MFKATTNHCILHRRRSHKSLRVPDGKDVSHLRQSSISSSASDASTTSSDSCRQHLRQGSIEWDPLKLHPPMPATRSPYAKPHLNDSGSHLNDPTEGEDCSAGGGQQPLVRRENSQESAGFALEVYDGFDFGFGKPLSPARPAASRPDQHQHMVDGRAWRPSTPVPSSPEGDSHSETGSAESSPRPRPHPAGYGSTDYFIKRGNWKRRGIVFDQEECQLVDDEDTWEIP